MEKKLRKFFITIPCLKFWAPGRLGVFVYILYSVHAPCNSVHHCSFWHLISRPINNNILEIIDETQV